MARLLTVVNERKKLRSEYRVHLENEYIATKKAKEQKSFLERRAKLKEQGVTNLPMTPDEVKTMLKERDEKKRAKLQEARDTILSQIESGETVLAPQIN